MELETFFMIDIYIYISLVQCFFPFRSIKTKFSNDLALCNVTFFFSHAQCLIKLQKLASPVCCSDSCIRQTLCLTAALNKLWVVTTGSWAFYIWSHGILRCYVYVLEFVWFTAGTSSYSSWKSTFSGFAAFL